MNVDGSVGVEGYGEPYVFVIIILFSFYSYFGILFYIGFIKLQVRFLTWFQLPTIEFRPFVTSLLVRFLLHFLLLLLDHKRFIIEFIYMYVSVLILQTDRRWRPRSSRAFIIPSRCCY